MKNLKKVLALVLTLAMMFSVMIVNVGGADAEADGKQEKIGYLQSEGLVKGYEDGDIRADQAIVRSEAATMLARMLADETTIAAYANLVDCFSDVPSTNWAAGYISFCASEGILNGVGDNNFNPSESMTVTQFLKGALCALGYDAATEGLIGEMWDDNTVALASKTDLLDNVTTELKGECTRSTAAQMITNTLKAEVVEYNVITNPDTGETSKTLQKKTNPETGDTVTLGEETLGFLPNSMCEGILVDVSYVPDTEEYTCLLDTNGISDTSVNTASFTATEDYSDLVGEQVHIFARADKSVLEMVTVDSDVPNLSGSKEEAGKESNRVFSDQSNIAAEHTEAVDGCVVRNIIQGFTDGSFQPNCKVTRAQMDKMIYMAQSNGKELLTGTTVPSFSDVSTTHWAFPYIESCVEQKIVSGIGGGKFAPDGEVTATQAAKMLLIALGYDAEEQGLTGDNWYTNTDVLASACGLYNGLEDIDKNAALTREHAAQMMWNALNAEKSLPSGQKSTLLNRRTGTLTGFDCKLTGEGKQVYTYYVDTDGNGTYEDGKDTCFWSYTDHSGLLAQTLQFSENEKYVYDLYAVGNISVSGLIGELPDLKDTDTKLPWDEMEYTLDKTASSLPVYQFMNGEKDLRPFRAENADSIATLAALAGEKVTAYDSQKFVGIDRDSNGKIDTVLVYPASVARVAGFASDQADSGGTSLSSMATLDKIRAFGCGFYNSDSGAYAGTASVSVNRNSNPLSRDTYVVYTAANNTATDTPELNAISLLKGTVTAVSGRTFTMDNTTYTIDSSCSDSVSAGDKLTDVVCMNGYVFRFERTSVIQSSSGGGGGSSRRHTSSSGYAVVTDTDDSAVTMLLSNGSTVQTILSSGHFLDYDGKEITDAETVIGGLFSYSETDGTYQLTQVTDKGIASSSETIGYLQTDETGKVIAVEQTESDSFSAGTGVYNISDTATVFIQSRIWSFDKEKEVYFDEEVQPDIQYDVISGAELKEGVISSDASLYYVYVPGGILAPTEEDEIALGEDWFTPEDMITGEADVIYIVCFPVEESESEESDITPEVEPESGESDITPEVESEKTEIEPEKN